MLAAPIPANEAQRQQFLQRLALSTQKSYPALDQITEMAQSLFDVPIALISIVESEQQCFISNQGLGVDSTARDISFCGHIVANGAPMLVEDARLDPRFADNPLVLLKENPVIFYAGYPLTLNNGLHVGTLCLIDHQPRQLNAQQQAHHQRLARMAQAILEKEWQQIAQTTLTELLKDAKSFWFSIDKSSQKLHFYDQTAGHQRLYTWKDWLTHTHPDDRHHLAEQFAQLTQSQVMFYRWRSASGPNWTWLQHTFFIEHNERGTTGQIFCLCQPADEWMDTLANLSTTQTLNQLALQASNMGTWFVELENPDASSLPANIKLSSESCQLINLPAGKSVTLKRLKSLIHPNYWQGFLRQSLQAIRQHSPLNYSLPVQHNQQWRWLEVRGKTIIKPDTQTPLLLGVLIDIEQQIQLQHQLQKQKKLAQDFSELQSQFLSRLSHELRTPLNIISGMAFLIGDSQHSAEQQPYLQELQTATADLTTTIENLFEFSKLQSQQATLHPQNFNLAQQLKPIELEIAAKAQQKGLDFQFDLLPNNLDVNLIGDAQKLQEILLYLLNNAVKFTKQGTIELRIESWPTPSHMQLAFTIIDSGIGMSELEQQRILMPFEQADMSATREYEGIGLGLSICSRLLELFDSQLTIQSTLGVGSRFHFQIELPFSDSKEKANAQHHEPQTSDRSSSKGHRPNTAQTMPADPAVNELTSSHQDTIQGTKHDTHHNTPTPQQLTQLLSELILLRQQLENLEADAEETWQTLLPQLQTSPWQIPPKRLSSIQDPIEAFAFDQAAGEVQKLIETLNQNSV